MTREQWKTKMTNMRYKVKGSFGYDFYGAFKWASVEAIESITVNTSTLTTQFNVCLTSGKKIEIQKSLESRMVSVPWILGARKWVQEEAQAYFDNPCEELIAVKKIRADFIRLWRNSSNKP